MKNGYVYIMASKKNGTLYTGVTSDLMKRTYEHKYSVTIGFTSKYSVHSLVYFEECGTIQSAIEREKQIKGWKRIKKLNLIESMNPDWNDLSMNWFLDSSLRSE